MENPFEFNSKPAPLIVYESICEILHNGMDKLYCLNARAEDMRFSMPEFLMNLFIQGARMTFPNSAYAFYEFGQKLEYMGVTFVPTYNLEVSVWYKDYPLYPKEDMIYKVQLDAPVIESKPTYQKLIFTLGEVFPNIKIAVAGLN